MKMRGEAENERASNRRSRSDNSTRKRSGSSSSTRQQRRRASRGALNSQAGTLPCSRQREHAKYEVLIEGCFSRRLSPTHPPLAHKLLLSY